MEYTNNKNIKTIATTKISNSPLAIKVSGETVYILDNLYNYYEISLNTYGITRSSNLIKFQGLLHKYSKLLSFSPLDDIAFCAVNTKKISILSNAQGALSSKTFLAWHDEEVETTIYSDDGLLFASGGADGRVIIYNPADHYKIVAIQEKRPDYICSLAFSPDNRFLLSASFDKEIVIYDIQRNVVQCHFKLSDVAERAVFFEFDKIFITTRGGKSIIYDIFTNQITSQKNHFASWPVSLELSSDHKTAIIGTKNENIYLVDIPTNTLLIATKLEDVTGVTSLKLHNGVLIICHSDGKIDFIEYDRDINKLKISIRSKNYDHAAKLLNGNCFLAANPEFVSFFDEGWKTTLPTITRLIAVQKLEEASSLAEPFLNTEKRILEFEFYMSKNREVELFTGFVTANDIPSAYAMAEKNQFLKKLASYELLEENWRKTFNHCRRLLEEDANLYLKKVTEILKAYEQVEEKKKLSYSLMTNSKKFTDAAECVKRGDFVCYFDLVEKNQFLKETEVYQKTMTLAQSILDKVQELEAEGRLEEAMDRIKVLKNFKPFAITVTIKEANLSESYSFYKAVKAAPTSEEALRRAYDMALQNPNFQSLPIFSELTQEFRALYSEAMKLAYEAKIEEILYIFGKYMKVDFYRQKIKELFKQAFIRELELSLESKKSKIEHGIRRYMDIFALEPQIEKFASKNGYSSVLESIKNRPSVAYTVFEYPKSIFL